MYTQGAGNTGTWTITSSGAVPYQNGSGALTRTTSATTTITGGGLTGNLCISGNHAAIVQDTANGGQAVDIRVGGTLTINSNGASVGSSGTPLTSG
jgi:hypothetical protein